MGRVMAEQAVLSRGCDEGSKSGQSKVAMRSLSRYASPVLVLALLVLGWWGLVSILAIPSYICPTPLQVWGALTAIGWGYWPDVSTTTQEILGGFGLGLAVGLLFATIMSRWRTARDGLYPPLIFSQVVPLFVVAVIVTLVFINYGLLPEIIVTALYSFFPIVVTAADGLNRVDRELLDLLRGAGASEWRIFRTVRVPSALPSVFSGSKLAMVFAVSGAAFSEWIGGENGLGYRIRIDYGMLELKSVFATAFVLTVLGVVMFAAVTIVEYMALPWNRGADTDLGGLWRGR
jgi:ABC-type nitrate/sulfonate/bicarbonate transport system permease component